MRRPRVPAGRPSPLSQFTGAAETAAQNVIGHYSTSFGMATRLLGARHRTHVRNIYALVRVADEIVDGVAKEAGLDGEAQLALLERYAADTHEAMRVGYSSDLIIHAFATTARAAGIDESLTAPFFDSMRADLAQQGDRQLIFDSAAHEDYVYGSAEVVGLMCLRVFLKDEQVGEAERQRLEHGARRLGAAFQNINFLRDLGDDTTRLGRSYLGNEAQLTDEELRRWVERIRSQLDDARGVIPLLPSDSRAAVRSALALFERLTERIARTPADELCRSRVRVPNPVKIALASRAVITTLVEGRR